MYLISHFYVLRSGCYVPGLWRRGVIHSSENGILPVPSPNVQHDQIELVIELEKALEMIDRLPSQSRKAFNYEAQITKLEEIERYQKLKLRLYEDLSDGIINKSEHSDF